MFLKIFNLHFFLIFIVIGWIIRKCELQNENTEGNGKTQQRSSVK